MCGASMPRCSSANRPNFLQIAEIKNAIIIASIVNKKSSKTFQLVSKKLTIYKAADYSILPPIKSGDVLPDRVSGEHGSPLRDAHAFVVPGKRWGVRGVGFCSTVG